MPHARPSKDKTETESKTNENTTFSKTIAQLAWAAADTSAPRKFPVGGDSILRGYRVVDVTTQT